MTRSAAPYRIAAEVRDEKNVGIARAVGRGQAQLILAGDLISRIMVHSSRESGLFVVYTELLDLDGSEIYVVAQPNLTGLSFGAGLLAYDPFVLIAEDDSAIAARAALAGPEVSHITRPAEHPPENGLLLGCVAIGMALATLWWCCRAIRRRMGDITHPTCKP